MSELVHLARTGTGRITKIARWMHGSCMTFNHLACNSPGHGLVEAPALTLTDARSVDGDLAALHGPCGAGPGVLAHVHPCIARLNFFYSLGQMPLCYVNLAVLVRAHTRHALKRKRKRDVRASLNIKQSWMPVCVKKTV